MDNKKYRKGYYLTTSRVQDLADTGVKIIGVDCRDEETVHLCTVVKGRFVDCCGHEINILDSQYSLRLENLSEEGETWISNLGRYHMYEAIEKEIEEMPKHEFKEFSGAFYKHRDGTESELKSNFSNEKSFVEYLGRGSSFCAINPNMNSYGYVTFSIETAVKMRDYLDNMIGLAEDSGYFTYKEMTLKDVEKELGYKVKLI